MNHQYFFFFGIHPRLSITELQAIFPTADIEFQDNIANIILTESLSDEDIQDIQTRMGGTIKIAKKLGVVEFSEVVSTISQLLIDRNTEEVKLTIGLNAHGIEERHIKKWALPVKKAVPFSMRFCNKDFKNLSSVVTRKQIITQKNAFEFNLIKAQDNLLVLSETLSCQDIDGYGKRDFEKPVRDAKNGMIPPKLAQIMINIAGQNAKTIYDPFCGTGTIMMEAMLMNKKTLGSDLNPKMIDASQKNITWLTNVFHTPQELCKKIFLHNATKLIDIQADAIVTEGYLGKPLRLTPTEDDLKKTDLELTKLYEPFFQNAFRNKIKTIVITLPVYRMRTNYGFMEKTLARIIQSGYNPAALGDFKRKSLIYGRKNQFLHREIFKFTLK